MKWLIKYKGIKLSITQCADMEKDICTIFTSEKLAYYNTGKRGKLYNKIFNLKRLSKGIFDDEEEPKKNMIHTFVPEADAALAIQFLRNGKVSNEELDLYWRKCSQLRFLQIEESKITSEVFELWPEYVKPSGYLLVDIDFKLKYPGAQDFKLIWSCSESKLLKMLQTKITSASVSALIKQLRENDEESKVFYILYSLHHLLPPQLKVVSAKDGSKMRKKFTVADSQESFAIVAETMQEINMKLNLLKLQKQNIQPRLLVLGELTNIKEIFVYFDGIRYPMVHILTAVDILFKIFFVFNLEFPNKSDLFYSFLQTFFYEIDNNKKNSKVLTFINDILHKN